MEKGENGKEKKENCKREGKKLKMGGESSKMRGDSFFFFLAFHFSKQRKFVLGLPKWNIFYREKKKFTPEKKNQEK